MDWKRSRITVKPREGWQPDRAYRVELLPGIMDLRNNRSNERRVITFTTGGPKPTTTLTGRVVDWSTSRPAQNALIEALLLPDSLPYRGLADSSGGFSLGPLPPGDYLVTGVIDQDRNQRAGAREAFDSVRVPRGKTQVGEMWAFEHDTTPPRATTVTVGDSLSANVELSQSLDPRLRLQPRNASVWILPDSNPVKVVSVLPKEVDDSLHARQTAKPDTSKADTTQKARQAPAAPGARRPAAPETTKPPSRPPLSNRLVVRVGDSLEAGRTLRDRGAWREERERHHGRRAQYAGGARARGPGQPQGRHPARLASEGIGVARWRTGVATCLRWTASCGIRRSSSCSTPRRGQRLSGAVRETLEAARSRRAGVPLDWAAEIREHLAASAARRHATRAQRHRRRAPHQSRPRASGTCGARRGRGDSGEATPTSSSISPPAAAAAGATTAAVCFGR